MTALTMLSYDDTLSRVRVNLSAIRTAFGADCTATIERSVDQVTWTPVRGASGLAVTASSLPADDYEFQAGVPNFYRAQISGQGGTGGTAGTPYLAGSLAEGDMVTMRLGGTLAPALIGKNSPQAITTATITVGAGGVPAGACILLDVGSSSPSSTIISVTDSKSNAYTQANFDNTNQSAWQWICANPDALVSGDEIVVTFGSASGFKETIARYCTGLDPSNPVDQTGHNGATSATPSVSTDAAIADADELAWVTMTNGNGGGEAAWGSPFDTNEESLHTGTTCWLSSSVAETSAAAVVTATAAITSAAFTALITTLKLAPVSGSDTATLTVDTATADEDFLVCAVLCDDIASAPTGITDTADNTWVLQESFTGVTPAVFVFRVHGAAALAVGGELTIAYAGTGSVKTAVLGGCSGLKLTGAVDQSVSGGATQGAGPVLVGINSDTNPRFTSLSAPAGGLLARRSYNGTNWPLTYQTCKAADDASMGVTVSLIDIKPDMTETIAGTLDDSLAAFAASCPDGTYVTYNHELEIHGSSPSTIRDSFSHAYDIMKAANPAIFIGQSFSSFDADSRSNFFPMSQWVSGGTNGGSAGDFVGIDGYQAVNGETPEQVFGPCRDQVRSVVPGMVIIATECGVNQLQWWPSWIAATYAYATSQGWPVLAYWNFVGSTYMYDDSDAISALAAVNAQSKAAVSQPQVSTGQLAQASELAVAALASADAGGEPAWQSGFSVLDSVQGGAGGPWLSLAAGPVTTTEPVTAGAVLAGSTSEWSMVLLTLKAASSVSSEYDDTITPAIAEPWLKSIAQPFLNMRVTVKDVGDVTRPARGSAFSIVGASLSVAVAGTRGARAYDLTVRTLQDTETAALAALLLAGDVLFLQVPSGYVMPLTGYYTVGDVTETRQGVLGQIRWLTLPLTEVAAPDPAVIGVTTTWQAVIDEYATWNDLMVANAAWNDVISSLATPADVIVQ